MAPSTATVLQQYTENQNNSTLEFYDNKAFVPDRSSLDENFLPSNTDDPSKENNKSNKTYSAEPNKAPSVSIPKPVVTLWEIPRVEKLQEWEGQVVSIERDKGIFTATLTDLTTGDTIETEEGDFPISDVRDSDIELFEEGAIFHWIIGYKYIGTTKERFSTITFRSMPRWTESELAAADKEAGHFNAIEWD